MERVRAVSLYLKGRLDKLHSKHKKHISEIRGKGLMLGIKCHDHVQMNDIVSKMMQEKVLIIPASDNVIRLTPPLIVEESHCDEMIEKLDLVMSQLP